MKRASQACDIFHIAICQSYLYRHTEIATLPATLHAEKQRAAFSNKLRSQCLCWAGFRCVYYVGSKKETASPTLMQIPAHCDLPAMPLS